MASEGNGKQTVLVGEDTNLAVLAIALCNVNDKLIMFKPGRLLNQNTTYYTSQLALNHVLKKSIMFVHAFSRCDSTSAIF